MEYPEIALAVLILCALTVTTCGVFAIVRLASTLSRFDRLVDRVDSLMPGLEGLLIDARDSLRSADGLAERLHDIAVDAKAFSAATRQELGPLFRQLFSSGSAAAQGLAHVSALIAATKVGLGVLGGSRRGGEHDHPNNEGELQ